MRRTVRGVDDDVRPFPHRGERFPFGGDRIGDRVARHRVRSPVLRVAIEECFVAGIQEEHRGLDARHGQPEHSALQVVEMEPPPGVDDHRQPGGWTILECDVVDDVLDERRRQVLHHLETEVLEVVGRQRFPRPGHAGDDDEVG